MRRPAPPVVAKLKDLPLHVRVRRATEQLTVDILPLGAPAPSVSSSGEEGDGKQLLVDHTSGAPSRLRRPRGAATKCFGEPGATWAGAALRLAGSIHIADNDVRVLLAGLPPHTPTVHFYGLESADVPFVAGHGRIDPGIRWTLQAWLRDVVGPSGAASNLFSATAVPNSSLSWRRA